MTKNELDPIIRAFGKNFKVQERFEIKILWDVLVPGNGTKGYFVVWPNAKWKNPNQIGVGYILLETDNKKKPSKKVHRNSSHRFDLCYFRIIASTEEGLLEMLEELEQEKSTCEDDED